MRPLLAAALVLALVRPAGADPDTEAAKQRFLQGTRAYDLGRYDEAVREYEAAYKLKDDPALLYNIGQAYRLAGKPADAARSYKSFLRRMPTAKNRVAVEQLAEQQQKLADEQAAREAADQQRRDEERRAQEAREQQLRDEQRARLAEQAQPQRTAGDPRRARSMKIAGLTLIGVGGAGLILGATFVGLAAKANGEINPAGGTFSARAEDARNRDQVLGAVLLAIGGVAAASGIPLYVLGRRAATRYVIAPLLGPNGAGAWAQGEW